MKKSFKRFLSVRKGGRGKEPAGRSLDDSSLPLQSPNDSAAKETRRATMSSMDTGAVPVDQNSMLKENENTLHASNVHEKTDSSMNEESAIKDYGEETTDAESPPDNQHIPSTNMNPQLKQSPPLEIQDASFLVKSYDQIPVLEQTKLPRGGISVETAAVGRVQFGIPPETIKDSMSLGIPVPQIYIVPVERFCREMGPALGVNLAEFEFPAYFNFFVYKKRCTLVVDSIDAEENIRRVFSETLLGPAQFRREVNPIEYEPEDFSPNFPKEAIPNFHKELKHFRIMPDGKELVIETLLDFTHFEMPSDGHYNLGVPPPLDGYEMDVSDSVDECFVHDFCGDEEDLPEEEVPKDAIAVEKREKKTPWTYSQARYDGEVATIWPKDTTEEQKKKRNVPHVEIFKMPGGTEYIIHDVDGKNHIVGKARVSGHVVVPESMSVEGFGGHSILDDIKLEMRAKGTKEETEKSESSHQFNELIAEPPPSFHPPSFGVTVLGNSHGFDKSGSVSGYVLWINGRGVMIDPPPYSSATLERQGIRPRTIVGIILTHCHADHDAGAFQKVLTGTPVVVITTPTIYKSFIRKYAALSALSPALLRHSHRYKPAIIGEPLRFQGATFHFIYSLHTIPCVGFRVEWRGRSIVFTADHFNSPPGMQKLEESGVLTKERADDLRSLALQECDVLLHEAGAPPIHTPLEVLMQLPPEVKKRLYVVHTSALPEGCGLRVAPTGTKGTLRLDQLDHSEPSPSISSVNMLSSRSESKTSSFSCGDDGYAMNAQHEYGNIKDDVPKVSASSKGANSIHSSFAHLEVPVHRKGRNSVYSATRGTPAAPPAVALRPPSSTDAWFILNLLSAVPFISSLSYTSTMELLETAKVDAFRKDDIIIPASCRGSLLCVIWEGTCTEMMSETANEDDMKASIFIENRNFAVWHAGDWTGPLSFQPDRSLSGDSPTSHMYDIVAVSAEGVKVIVVEISNLHRILKSGSTLYRKYLDRKSRQEQAQLDIISNSDHQSAFGSKLFDDALKTLNVLELLGCNSALRKLNAVQKRHLESLAEGPVHFQPGERLWRAGTPVDKAFIIVSGSVSFTPKRRNAGSLSAAQAKDCDLDKHAEGNIGAEMHLDAKRAVKELGKIPNSVSDSSEMASLASIETEEMNPSAPNTALPLNRVLIESGSTDPNHFEKLKRGLERRANNVTADGSVVSLDSSHDCDTESDSQYDYTFMDETDAGAKTKRTSVIRRRSSHARKANKVLGRLYNRRAFTGGLVFSRGHFLGDVSKMVAGLLASDEADIDQDGPAYGFGDQVEGKGDTLLSEQAIPEDAGEVEVLHSSTLTAGAEGCVVLVFPKSSLIPFLDQYPGLLLSLLGTQVVV